MCSFEYDMKTRQPTGKLCQFSHEVDDLERECRRVVIPLTKEGVERAATRPTRTSVQVGAATLADFAAAAQAEMKAKHKSAKKADKAAAAEERDAMRVALEKKSKGFALLDDDSDSDWCGGRPRFLAPTE